MNLIEPTYLRYVHDSLDKGSISAENAAALPYGFIGLYEEAFQSNIPISKRQSTLKRLAIWALFKGGVSAYLASQILNESQEETKLLIDSFSSWFNTTDSNKYILYHDRLRSYLLQKLSSHELQELNEQIISYLEKALEAQKGDEAEIYALEHLSTHMATESQMDSNYQRLHDFANQETLWPRQVSVSKEYKWSQQAVQYSIKEGARRHHEMNTISSTVNSVKMMQDEKNNVNQILNLLNKGDYKIALERALFFSGEKLITIYLIMINGLLINENQSDNYKSKVYQEIIEIIKKSDVKQKDFPVILIYEFYLEFKRLNLDYSVLLENYSFNYCDILYLLEFDIEILELEYLVKNFIHVADHPDIYIAISKFYLDRNDKNKTVSYLKKSQDVIKKITFSYSGNYNFTGIEGDTEYYRTKLKWKILIGFIYFEIKNLNSAKEALEDIFLFIKEINSGDKNDNKKIYSQLWFEIYHLCILLGSHEYVINSNDFNDSISRSSDQIPKLLRVLLVQEDYIQYEKFINHINNKNFSKIIFLEIDYFITLCKSEELKKVHQQEQKIIEKINSLEFGEIKFDSLIYFGETLFLTEKFIKNKHEAFSKRTKTLANKIIEHFNYNLKRLSDQNSDFYFSNISKLIKTFFNLNKIDEALEKYDIYFNEIIKKNIKNPKERHSFFNILFDSILSFNYKSSVTIIKKAEEIINDKNYYSDESEIEPYKDIKYKTFKDLIKKGFEDEALIFAKKHNIKVHLFGYNDYQQNGIKLDLEYNIYNKNDLFEINKHHQTFSILTNSQSHYNESISLKSIHSLSENTLFEILDFIKNNNKLRFSLEIGTLKIRGFNELIQNFLLVRQKSKLPVFKYQKKCPKLSEYYKSLSGDLIEKTRIPIVTDITNYNYIILDEISNKISWTDLEDLIDKFKFEINLQRIPFIEINNISSPNKLVLEDAFLNVKLKLLSKKLYKNKDHKLINKLFQSCSELSENFVKGSKIENRNRRINHSAFAFLQFSNVLNQINLPKKSIEAIYEALKLRKIETLSEYPSNENIFLVFIHICMSSLEKSETLIHFNKIIDSCNIYIENIEKDSPEQLLYLFLEPLVQISEISRAIQVTNMILEIIEKIPVKHTKMLYMDENGWELPNTELARKQKSISNISYFYYAIGDLKKGDEFYNLLSDELIYNSDSFYGDDERQVGFDKNEVLNKYKNKKFSKYEKVVLENIELKEKEEEFNGAIYKEFKDRKSMESNFDFSFLKNSIEFQFLSKNQNPHESFSYLFYKAKMACFFEDDKKEEKLDLLEQVIDIKEWREISANV